MTPEVKQRIEQIRQGIVPEGYKKTKTGIVPADWKESPVGEYIREYTEKTTIPNQYPVLTSARTGLMLQTDYYSNRQVTTEDNVGYNVLPYGYITFRSRSDDGRFRFNENRIIKRGIISYFYPVFSFSEEVCHEYMLYLLNFSIYRRMYPYAEGTAQQVLSLKKLGQLKYSLPPVAEQKKIAEILSTHDKVIELQARKIEELKRFKKGCLEKMFPRKGQKVPEKRFPGFTDDWEQRKAQDVADRFDNLRIPVAANLRVHGTTPYYGANGIQDYVEGFTHDGEFVLVAEDGANDLKNYPVKCVNGRIWVNNHAHVLQGKAGIADNSFLAFAISQSDIESLLVGGGRAKLNAETLMSIEFRLPCLQEQYRIGEYLTQLDHLITLHQRKLEEMKKQKKALMQLLLTGIVRVKP